MANEQNLIPFTSDQSHEEAVKNGAKGGQKSGEARRRKKALKEILQMLLERDYDVDGKKVQGDEAISVALVKQALGGNVKAYETIRDTLGEKPTDTVNLELNNDACSAYEKAAAAIKGNDK